MLIKTRGWKPTYCCHELVPMYWVQWQDVGRVNDGQKPLCRAHSRRGVVLTPNSTFNKMGTYFDSRVRRL